MTELKFDNPKLNEMQEFIKYLYTLRVQNPNMSFNDDVVYHEFCKAGLKRGQLTPQYELINNELLFDKWVNKYNNFENRSSNLRVFVDPEWDYFIQFTSQERYVRMMHLDRQFIKLYIPIDFQHLYEGVNQLFNFIKEQNIMHLSKVSKRVRSDNVIVRLRSSDYEGAKKIIDFVNSNPYFKDGLNKTNPFIPTINGIGFMQETGISYNKEMSELLSNFITIYAQMQVPPTIQNFYDWFKKNCNNKEVEDIFESALGIEKKLTPDQKAGLFFDALKATYKKYGMNQIVRALIEIIQNNNYSFITNGTGKAKYRNLLIENVSRNEIIKFIKVSLNITQDNISYDDINKFCYKLFENDTIYKLNDACQITFSKYGVEQVKTALSRAIYESDYRCFTRSSNDENNQTNYREKISKFDGNSILFAIKKSLELKNIAYNPQDINELIEMYSLEISKANYLNEGNTPKISR